MVTVKTWADKSQRGSISREGKHNGLKSFLRHQSLIYALCEQDEVGPKYEFSKPKWLFFTSPRVKNVHAEVSKGQ